MKDIKVKTIAEKHVAQLSIEHYWDGEYDWRDKIILGRLASSGCLLLQDSAGALHCIAPFAFIDGQLEKLGCRKKVKGKWEYVPTPHTEYSRKAREEYSKIPQLFTD